MCLKDIEVKDVISAYDESEQEKGQIFAFEHRPAGPRPDLP